MPMSPRLMRPRKAASGVSPTPVGANPYITMISAATESDYMDFGVKTTTGYAKIEWWDGTTEIQGTGNPSAAIGWARYSDGATANTILIKPTDASGNLSGSITLFYTNGSGLTSLDILGLTALASLELAQHPDLAVIDVSQCQGIQTVVLMDTGVQSLNLSGKTLLQYVYIQGCPSLTSLNLSGCQAITTMDVTAAAVQSLDVSANAGLLTLNVQHCPSLASFAMGACTDLSYCAINNNPSLVSLRAVGFEPEGLYYLGYYGPSVSYGADIGNNALSAAALNQFYTDLAPGNGHIFVGGNPGVSGDTPSIATAKGHVVYGS